MVDRYGDFVRYKPALNAKTALLWFGPAGCCWRFRDHRGDRPPSSRATRRHPGSLSAEERERLDHLLDKTKND
jgi:cytochrome c-type biogenesis protein CcmH